MLKKETERERVILKKRENLKDWRDVCTNTNKNFRLAVS